MNIDLHCHSNVSDGALPPVEVVRLAKENGAKLLALTDHDNLQGLPAARAEAARLDLPFVNGVEVSITWNSKVIHIVGLNMRDEASELQAALDTLRSGRITRLQLMSEKLGKKASQARMTALWPWPAIPTAWGVRIWRVIWCKRGM